MNLTPPPPGPVPAPAAPAIRTEVVGLHQIGHDYRDYPVTAPECYVLHVPARVNKQDVIALLMAVPMGSLRAATVSFYDIWPTRGAVSGPTESVWAMTRRRPLCLDQSVPTIQSSDIPSPKPSRHYAPAACGCYD